MTSLFDFFALFIPVPGPIFVNSNSIRYFVLTFMKKFQSFPSKLRLVNICCFFLLLLLRMWILGTFVNFQISFNERDLRNYSVFLCFLIGSKPTALYHGQMLHCSSSTALLHVPDETSLCPFPLPLQEREKIVFPGISITCMHCPPISFVLLWHRAKEPCQQ